MAELATALLSEYRYWIMAVTCSTTLQPEVSLGHEEAGRPASLKAVPSDREDAVIFWDRSRSPERSSTSFSVLCARHCSPATERSREHYIESWHSGHASRQRRRDLSVTRCSHKIASSIFNDRFVCFDPGCTHLSSTIFTTKPHTMQVLTETALYALAS